MYYCASTTVLYHRTCTSARESLRVHYSQRNACVLSVDGFTKFEEELYTAALHERLPHAPLAPEPESKAPNLINNASFAAGWTDKDSEAFDDA